MNCYVCFVCPLLHMQKELRSLSLYPCHEHYINERSITIFKTNLLSVLERSKMLVKNAAIKMVSLVSVWLKGAQSAWVQMTAEAKCMWSFLYATRQALCEWFERLSNMYKFWLWFLNCEVLRHEINRQSMGGRERWVMR